MLTEVLRLLLCVIGGLLLGQVFFGGLWWTVRKGLSARSSPLWFTGSALARTAAVLGGFYGLLQGDWRNGFAGLTGFFAARLIVTRRLAAQGA
jgi:F1F0 ATPase subunit 2